LPAKIRSLQRSLLDSMVRGNPGLGLDKRADYFVGLFEEQLEPGSRVLDIGGGWGFYAEPLARRGHHLTVLDVVKPGFQKAPVVVYPGGRFPFEDKVFDASMMITMLHHTPDPAAIVREAVRVTRRRIIVVEDIYRSAAGRIWTILRDQIYNFEFFGHPCQFKKREEWLALFEREGCKLVEDRLVRTRLAGMGILNGVFILRPGE
jgi:ubiquinone/menaquinone biosynthesis C-methylase UbiE